MLYITIKIGENMRNFFSKDKFNILDLLSLIIILIGLFKDNIIYIFIGAYIQIAQRISVHFKEYRNTKKLKVYFIIDLSIFFMITLIFIKNIFSICT